MQLCLSHNSHPTIAANTYPMALITSTADSKSIQDLSAEITVLVCNLEVILEEISDSVHHFRKTLQFFNRKAEEGNSYSKPVDKEVLLSLLATSELMDSKLLYINKYVAHLRCEIDDNLNS